MARKAILLDVRTVVRWSVVRIASLQILFWNALTMHRDKYVCFDCRMAFKRAFLGSGNVKCCSCANTCTEISYKIPIPPKKDIKKWEALRLQIRALEDRIANMNIEQMRKKSCPIPKNKR